MSTTKQAEVSTILLDKVADWLTSASLGGEDLESMVECFFERVTAAGLPIMRAHLTFAMLHPLYDALGFTWKRGQGMEVEGYRRPAGELPERFLRSPYYHLLSNKLDHLRCRLDTSSPAAFPILKDLKQEGGTDYLAYINMFGDKTGQGMMGSWTTDNEDGFSESMIAALLRLQNHLAVATRMAMLSKLADNMLSTYLGEQAGKRVLNGQIRRGEGETIRAALVMGDMRNSTRLAETVGREVYIETLNQFFDAIAGPFKKNGGQILSFLGDGFLAVYPCERHKHESEIACRSALEAAKKATARMAELNAERRGQGLEDIGYGLGLHVGNVMFGNVGLSDRLTFSAFGSAVNEVQRLQNLTKRYPHPLVASTEFSTYCGGDWTMIGRFKVAGVGRKMTVLHPGLAVAEAEAEPRDAEVKKLSDGEQVMLLLQQKSAQARRQAA